MTEAELAAELEHSRGEPGSASIERLVAEARALKALLGRCEFACRGAGSKDIDIPLYPLRPECLGVKPGAELYDDGTRDYEIEDDEIGHAPDCALAAALR